MIAFEGPEVVLGISANQLREELKDLAKVGEMLPADMVKDFEASVDKCSFKVKGGIAIHLEKDKEQQNEIEGVIVKMLTVAPTPVRFSLEVVALNHENGCTCRVRSDADLNPFTKMMVEPALKSLFKEMASRMEERFPVSK